MLSSTPASASTSAGAKNSTTCGTLYAHRASARVLMPLFYSVVFVVGLSGNVLALYVIRPVRKKMNSTTLYSLNLVGSDILFTLSVPFRLVYYALGFHWPMGEVLCRVSGFLFYVNTYAGVSFMTCLSVDRFIAMVLPLRLANYRKVDRVRYICAIVWVLVLFQTVPLMGMRMSHQEPTGHITCMEYPNMEALVEHLAPMLIAGVFLGYLLPLTIILLCYAVIWSKLRLSARSSGLGDRSGRRRKAVGVICCVTLVFMVCYSPYHVNLLQYMLRKLLQTPPPGCKELSAFQVSLHVTVCLMNLNPCLDPFVYFFACKGYKRQVLKLLRRQTSVSVSSAARTEPEGSSRDAVGDNKIPLHSKHAE